MLVWCTVQHEVEIPTYSKALNCMEVCVQEFLFLLTLHWTNLDMVDLCHRHDRRIYLNECMNKSWHRPKSVKYSQL